MQKMKIAMFLGILLISSAVFAGTKNDTKKIEKLENRITALETQLKQAKTNNNSPFSIFDNDPFFNFHENMERNMENHRKAMNKMFENAGANANTVKIEQTNEEMKVVAKLPDFDKKDVSIEVIKNNILVISAKKSMSKSMTSPACKECKCHKCECKKDKKCTCENKKEDCKCKKSNKGICPNQKQHSSSASSSSFQQRIMLPKNANIDKISSNFRKKELTVTIPLSKKTVTKKIKIN